MTTNLKTNAKAGNADAEQVDRVIRWAREQVAAGKTFDGEMDMRQILAAVTLTYSRAWQIAALELALATAANRMVPAEVKADPAKYAATVIALRDGQKLSWGKIGVLCLAPEGEVRAMYRKNAGNLDRGLRIGKGGRFVMDEKAIYDLSSHSDGAIIDAKVLEDKAMGKLRDAVRAEDAKVVNQYIANSALKPAKPVRKASKRMAKAA